MESEKWMLFLGRHSARAASAQNSTRAMSGQASVKQDDKPLLAEETKKNSLLGPNQI